MIPFRTHTGEIVDGAAACRQVATDLTVLAFLIHEENAYASHVTEEVKVALFLDRLERAQKVWDGTVDNFTVWQRVNQVLTGECVPFLPKVTA
jgi:hypothetical protein